MGVEALGTGECVNQGEEMGYSSIHIGAHIVFWGWRAVRGAGTGLGDGTGRISIFWKNRWLYLWTYM